MSRRSKRDYEEGRSILRGLSNNDGNSESNGLMGQNLKSIAASRLVVGEVTWAKAWKTFGKRNVCVLFLF